MVPYDPLFQSVVEAPPLACGLNGSGSEGPGRIRGAPAPAVCPSDRAVEACHDEDLDAYVKHGSFTGSAFIAPARMPSAAAMAMQVRSTGLSASNSTTSTPAAPAPAWEERGNPATGNTLAPACPPRACSGGAGPAAGAGVVRRSSGAASASRAETTRQPRSPETTGPQLAVTAATMKGQKAVLPNAPNQDAHLVMHFEHGVMLAAVFDGHGREGHHSSTRTREIFEHHGPGLAALPRAQLPQAFHTLFDSVHEALCREDLAFYSGTTVTVCLIDAAAGIATVAYVGDSAVMIARGPDVLFRTQDHIIDEEVEKHVKACGGEVRELNYCNIQARRIFCKGSPYPGLAMSRALGDQEGHAIGVRSDPDVLEVPLPPGATLVVASDGVWERMPVEVVAPFVAAEVQDPGNALVARAREHYDPSRDIDDITAIVVRLGEANL